MLSSEEWDAVRLFGVRQHVKDGRRVLRPVRGVKSVGQVVEAVGDVDPTLLKRLLDYMQMPKAYIDRMIKTKRAVRGLDGKVELRTYIPGLNLEPLDQFAEFDSQEFGEPGVIESFMAEEGTHVGVRPKRPRRKVTFADQVGHDGEHDGESRHEGTAAGSKRKSQDERERSRKRETHKYTMIAVFTDASLTDKLRLSSVQIQGAKRLAVVDPADAARMLTSYVRANGFVNSIVVVGDYSKSVGQYRDLIRATARTIQYVDVGAPATFISDRVYITYDGFHGDGSRYWTVSGPVANAVEVQAVYELSIVKTPQAVMCLLAMATLALRIEIYDEVQERYLTGSFDGFSSLQGVEPMGYSLPGKLTAAESSRVTAAAQHVLPVFIGGNVVGSAVQVTEKHVVFNEHTMVAANEADQSLVISGQEVFQTHMLAHDLCTVRRPGFCSGWHVRQPYVGENVILVYHVGKAREYSEVLRVKSLDESGLVLSYSTRLRKGTSGAAVVSVRDAALLGILSTIRTEGVVCTTFSPAKLLEVSEADSTVPSVVGVDDGQSVQQALYDRMGKKGLRPYLQALVSASEPLYVRSKEGTVHAGTMVNYGGRWHTAVGPDKAQLYDQNSVPVAWTKVRKRLYESKVHPVGQSKLLAVRKPRVGEEVFLMARRGDETGMTPGTFVEHVSSNGLEFALAGVGSGSMSLDGAMVVSVTDGAVLGLRVASGVAVGGSSLEQCVTFGDSLVERGGAGLGAFVAELADWAKTAKPLDWQQSVETATASLLAVATPRVYAVRLPTGFAFTFVEAWKKDYELIMTEGLGWTDKFWSMFPGVDRFQVACAYLTLLRSKAPDNFDISMNHVFQMDEFIEERFEEVIRESAPYSRMV